MTANVLNPVWIFLHLAGLLISARGVGRLFFRQGRCGFASKSEALFFETLIGLSVLALILFLLCWVQWANQQSVRLAVAFWAALAAIGFYRSRKNINLLWSDSVSKPVFNRVEKGSVFLLGVLLIFCLPLVLTPAVGNDALVYHLQLPRLFMAHGGFYYVQGNIFNQYPLHTEMLYMAGLALSGDILAKGLNFAAALLTLLGMYAYMSRHMKAALPFTGLLIFFAIPSVFANAHLAYSDIFFTLNVIAALFAFTNWLETERNGWLVMAGLFSGLCMATKYAGLFLPPLGVLGVLVHFREKPERLRAAIRCAGIYLAATVIVGCPFYIKNLVLTGNPLYPFFYGLFGGRGWDEAQARVYDLLLNDLGMGRSLLDYLLLPLRVSLFAQPAGPKFDGVLGPVFLMALPFILVAKPLSRPARLLCVYSFLTFCFWASSAQQIRYLFPVFAALAMVSAEILGRLSKKRPVFLFLTLIIAGSLVYNSRHIAYDYRAVSPTAYLLGKESRNAFLGRHIPSLDSFNTVNSRLPEDARVFLIYMKNRGFLLDRDYYSDSMIESYTIGKILASAESPGEVTHALRKMGMTHILFDIHYVLGPRSPLPESSQALFRKTLKTGLQNIHVSKGRFYLYRIK